MKWCCMRACMHRQPKRWPYCTVDILHGGQIARRPDCMVTILHVCIVSQMIQSSRQEGTFVLDPEPEAAPDAEPAKTGMACTEDSINRSHDDHAPEPEPAFLARMVVVGHGARLVACTYHSHAGRSLVSSESTRHAASTSPSCPLFAWSAYAAYTFASGMLQFTDVRSTAKR